MPRVSVKSYLDEICNRYYDHDYDELKGWQKLKIAEYLKHMEATE